MFQKFFKKILKHRRFVLIIYLILSLLCIIAGRQVDVDNNLADYLPEDSDSTIALHVMEEEFGSDIPNAELMVKDISFAEAVRLQEKIEEVEGVTAVSWVTGANSTIPAEMYPSSLLEGKYEDGCALYSLTLDNTCTIDLANEIRGLTDHETAMSGSFINSKVVAAKSSGEIIRVVALVVLFGILVLMLTLDTWLEPILLVLCLFCAVVLNSGSNIVFGTISNVTKTASSVLQMAVSVDYFIFILHRYKEIRMHTDAELSPENAMAEALKQSTLSVSSSSLTTIMGFVALIFMRYGIGLDLGLVLAKGVLISLICAFTLMPCVILIFDRWIMKSRHKVIIRGVGKLPEFCWKLRIPLALLFIICMIPSAYLQHQNAFYYGTSHSYKESSWVMEERQEIEDVFGRSNTIAIMVPTGDTSAEIELAEELETLPEVRSVTSYASLLGYQIPVDMLPESITSQLLSENYSRIILRIDADEESEETFQIIDRLKDIIGKYYESGYHMAGNSVSTYDLKKVISADSVKVNLIAVLAIFLILVASFRKLRIPVILTLGIEGAIWINMTIPYITGAHLFYIGYLVVSSILLGATVDYAILMTSRYGEYRTDMTYREAILTSLRQSAISIFTSGSILIVAGILLWQISTNQLIAQLGFLLARGTFLAIIMVIFVLPALLRLQ